ncbi:C-3',4' desaturase CrtD [Leptothermofonsia sp. ETS-13]|uniref:C-3',4' desaturase CrtD n=1 Tax=Leptothermofonsia sp. ETS-13 TaxID=3035696 RepID=UPI003BA16552
MAGSCIDTQHSPRRVVVVGAGIGGLTAGALLARRGYSVLVLDQAIVPGGCASTFQRRGFTFDVGATQVAGLEPGGIHHRIFSELEIDLPEATPCDPACAVYLPGERLPINVWREPEKWKAERQRQFPGSEPFWRLLADLFQVSWTFQSRDPVLPPRNLWDLGQLLRAVRPRTLTTLPHTFSTVGDVLRGYRLADNQRLKAFLDMQLKLYSQVEAEETALLYAATALNVSQKPQGLYHLHGSMQALSDRLVSALERDGGQLRMRHTVEQIQVDSGKVTGVRVRNQKTGEVWTEPADHVIANVTVQNLVQLLGDKTPQGYRQRVEKLPPASGAFVIYLGVDQAALPANCPPHLQFLYDYDGPIAENNSLFVSVSQPGDGRAPEGKATIIASSFTDVGIWWREEEEAGARSQEPGGGRQDITQDSKLQIQNSKFKIQNSYSTLKQHYTDQAIARLSQFFNLNEQTILHVEAATPRSFARFTGRDRGIVGGIGQRISTFGPFGFANRTPIQNLWLVGDSTHPGEGTAGVSYSALTVVRQVEAEKYSYSHQA